MTIENPTLKLRLAIPGHSYVGRDCLDAARDILESQTPVDVLDVKWGREPTKWRETGGGWGRPKLTEYERGFVEAVRLDPDVDARITTLLVILDRLMGGQA